MEEKPPEDTRKDRPEDKRKTRRELGVQAKDSTCKLPQKFTTHPPLGYDNLSAYENHLKTFLRIKDAQFLPHTY